MNEVKKEMPIELGDLETTEVAPITKREIGEVDWDGLWDALCELGFGEDRKGFSVNDVLKLTRNFAMVEYKPDGYPISRQRVYKWVMEKFDTYHAVRFRHRNAKDFRFAFQKEKLDKSDPRLKDYIPGDGE